MTQINQMIANRYMIVKHIGQGGMADVYVAVDTLLNREVAIKILRGELCSDPISLLRFQREAQASCALIHPNIVEIYDVGEDSNHHYIVMEYIRGRTLKQLINQRGALLKEEAVDIMKQLVSATQEAHKKGVIHRDIKPQNVLVKDDGTIKMVDFGIALAHDALQLTQADSVMGSVHYLAPELARGESATYQSDIYSLGILFYELLTGEVPFRGENSVQVALSHMRNEIPSVKDLVPSIPQSIENIILTATAKRKEYRYLTATHMLADLFVCLDPDHRNVAKVVFKVEGEEEANKTKMIDRVEKVERKTTKQAKALENTKKKEPRPMFAYFILILCIILAAFLLMWVVFLSTTMNRKSRMVEVPSCIGYTVTECDQILETVNLSINKASGSIEYETTDDVEAGRIISMIPNEATEVEKGTKIKIKVSNGIFATMEDYTGQNNKEVKAIITAKYPNIKWIAPLSEPSDLPPGSIIRYESNSLQPNEKFNPNDKTKQIRFVISEYKTLEIPTSIIGMNIEDAKTLLEERGAQVILNSIEMPNEEVEQGKVVTSNPDAGKWYTQEESNYITLSYY